MYVVDTLQAGLSSCRLAGVVTLPLRNLDQEGRHENAMGSVGH
jgi:hypothetical protein